MPFIRYTGEKVTVNGQDITVYSRDEAGDILLAVGTATIIDGATGYAKGALYIDTDIGAGSSGIFENVGTISACNFDTIGGGGGSTTFVALSDTPANFTAAGNKILKVNTGATAVEFVTVSGDVAMSSAGVMTVTDLTISSEAQNDMLVRGASSWDRLAAGADGFVLRSSSGVPTWVDPTQLPAGTASLLAQVVTIEAGANDIVQTTTTQTGGVGALSIPDFAGVADTYAFTTLQQTFVNKILTDDTCIFGATGALTKTAGFDLSGATAGQKLTLASAHSAARTITFPDATDTLVGKATTDVLTNKTLTSAVLNTAVSGTAILDEDAMGSNSDTQLATQQSIKAYVDSGTVVFTNKSIDADGTGNVITNLDGAEVKATADGGIGIPVVIRKAFTNLDATGVDIFTDNAPYGFRILDVWSVATSADGGSWTLNKGKVGALGTAITNTVTVAASDKDIDKATSIDNAQHEIASSGSLVAVGDGGGTLDIELYILCVRV